MKDKDRFLVNHYVSPGDVARVRENVTVPSSVKRFLKSDSSSKGNSANSKASAVEAKSAK